jgi:hypothetical protein
MLLNVIFEVRIGPVLATVDCLPVNFILIVLVIINFILIVLVIVNSSVDASYKKITIFHDRLLVCNFVYSKILNQFFVHAQF